MAPYSKDPNAPEGLNSATPILVAIAECNSIKDVTDIVRILAPLTENPNQADKNGRTPIHVAATLGYTEIVRILAPLSKNVNDKDKEGLTPMYMAALYGHSEILRILSKYYIPKAKKKRKKMPVAPKRILSKRKCSKSTNYSEN